MSLPNPPPTYLMQDQSDLRSALMAADKQNLKRGQDIDLKNARVFIYADDGSRWQLVVSSAGLLSTIAA